MMQEAELGWAVQEEEVAAAEVFIEMVKIRN